MRKIPIGNRILIELDEADDMIGGIVIPGIAEQPTPNIGTVRDLGTGELDKNGNKIPWEVAIGDRVIVEHTLDRITVKMEQSVYDVYRQNEIIGVINQ